MESGLRILGLISLWGCGRGLGERLRPVLGLFKKDPEKKNVGEERKKAPQDKAE
jgi:ATP-binding cassette subfamily G (WHITE) protein 2 (PDR)